MTSPIAQRLDHGAIGNGRVLALVRPDSAVDWLCLPQWDSPSVFGSLLDQEHGGTWRIDGPHGPQRGDLACARNTNVLVGTFRDGDAAWEVVDFAPRIRVHFDPRPDYGRADVNLIERLVREAITASPTRTPCARCCARCSADGWIAIARRQSSIATSSQKPSQWPTGRIASPGFSYDHPCRSTVRPPCTTS